ncbi:MAG: DUF3095 domain-containing protein [Bacteriovoracaceae bacterium]|nr:DUF3095 domain-containing protein [Bacteriovoracaceae bacterium]
MQKTNFYEVMTAFTDFESLTQDQYFAPVPNDWHVIITDVKGSTKAIEAGRYKDVNTVGAATIACAQNAMKQEAFPFVFGGDGATLLVPEHHLLAVTKELVALRSLSEKKFNLGLRVGIIKMQEILDLGGKIEVAKYQLVGKKSVAIFRGGGLALAEKKIKNSADQYEAKLIETSEANLTGLSCRWKPIRSTHGKIISLLVVSREKDEAATYHNVIQKLNEIFDGKLDAANPVNLQATSYKGLRQCLQEEMKYHSSLLTLSFLARAFEIFMSVLIFKFNLNPLIFNPKKYAASMKTHSDYRKFDDMLRMILDCTHRQFEQIENYLKEMYQEQKIYYGIHISEDSLMTCLVQDVKDGEHIHFIDGGNGGYAMAAKQLKQQLKG